MENLYLLIEDFDFDMNDNVESFEISFEKLMNYIKSEYKGTEPFFDEINGIIIDLNQSLKRKVNCLKLLMKITLKEKEHFAQTFFNSKLFDLLTNLAKFEFNEPSGKELLGHKGKVNQEEQNFFFKILVKEIYFWYLNFNNNICIGGPKSRLWQQHFYSSECIT